MIKVIDNFLDEFEFQIIERDFLLNPNMFWKFEEFTEYPPKENSLFQFVHITYDFRDSSPQGQYFESIFPILKKLNAREIIRSKVNLTTKSENIIRGDFHVDVLFEHKVAIFYLNTNNGYTLFEDGTKIESVANRMVLFDGHLRHLGTNCTDKQRRVVLNINYL